MQSMSRRTFGMICSSAIGAAALQAGVAKAVAGAIEPDVGIPTSERAILYIQDIDRRLEVLKIDVVVKNHETEFGSWVCTQVDLKFRVSNWIDMNALVRDLVSVLGKEVNTTIEFVGGSRLEDVKQWVTNCSLEGVDDRVQGKLSLLQWSKRPSFYFPAVKSS